MASNLVYLFDFPGLHMFGRWKIIYFNEYCHIFRLFPWTITSPKCRKPSYISGSLIDDSFTNMTIALRFYVSVLCKL